MKGKTSTSAEPRLLVVLIAVSMGMFIVELDFFAFNVALPAMAHDLGTTTTDLQWVISGYQLSFAALLIAGGRLGDIFGRRKTFIIGLLIFAAGALTCGLAPSANTVIAFRVVMGIGAALIFPVAISLLSNAFPTERRSRAIGVAYGVAAIGAASGPFVGGGLTEALSWRWVFHAMVLLSLIPLLLVLRSVRESRDETAPQQFDIGGLLAVSGGIAAVTYAIDRGQDWGWFAPRTLGVFVAGLALLGVFIAVERRVRWPLVDLRLFRNRAFDTVVAATTVSNVAFVVIIFVATLYLQEIRHLSPLKAGLIFVAPAAAAGLAGLAAGRLAERLAAEWILVGANAVGGIGVLLMILTHSPAAYVAGFGIAGFGLGLGWAFASVGTQAVTDPKRAGEASGVSLTLLIGLAGVAVVISASALREMGQHGIAAARAMEIVNIAVAILLATTVVGVAIFGRHLRAQTAPLE